jgi:hypothetical protein
LAEDVYAKILPEMAAMRLGASINKALFFVVVAWTVRYDHSGECRDRRKGSMVARPSGSVACSAARERRSIRIYGVFPSQIT